jgi:hypothetical protein
MQASTKPPSNMGDGFDCIQLSGAVSQKLAFTGTSAKSAALGGRTTVVRLYSTQDVHIKVAVDANATAVADGTCFFLPKTVSVLVGVSPGQKIAAIQDSAGGNLFITEGA